MVTYDVPDAHSIFVIKEGSSYTFSDYFKLGFTPKAVANFHRYQLRRSYMELPQAAVNQPAIETIRERIIAGVPLITTLNEMARREFMIAPIVFEVVITAQAEVGTEIPLKVSDSLRGNLDYLLEGADKTSVIVEAKRDDLENGFAQLAAELIALDQWTESEQTHIVGAVSTGKTWAFGVLERASKTIDWDMTVYTVPAQIECIVGIMVAALSG